MPDIPPAVRTPKPKRAEDIETRRVRRAIRLQHRIDRLRVLLGKREAELEQLGEEPMRLWWVSFVELSGRADDIVVRHAHAAGAAAAAALLLDDPHGRELVFELPASGVRVPIGCRLSDEHIQNVARLAGARP